MSDRGAAEVARDALAAQTRAADVARDAAARHAREMRLYVRLLAATLVAAILAASVAAVAALASREAAAGARAQGEANGLVLEQLKAGAQADAAVAEEQRRTAREAVEQVLAEGRRLDVQQQAELERLLNAVLAAVTAEVRDPQNREGRPTPAVAGSSRSSSSSSGAPQRPQAAPRATAQPAPRPPATPRPTTRPTPRPSSTPAPSLPARVCLLGVCLPS